MGMSWLNHKTRNKKENAFSLTHQHFLLNLPLVRLGSLDSSCCDLVVFTAIHDRSETPTFAGLSIYKVPVIDLDAGTTKGLPLPVPLALTGVFFYARESQHVELFHICRGRRWFFRLLNELAWNKSSCFHFRQWALPLTCIFIFFRMSSSRFNVSK